MTGYVFYLMESPARNWEAPPPQQTPQPPQQRESVLPHQHPKSSQQAQKSIINLPATKIAVKVLDILLSEGYILGYAAAYKLKKKYKTGGAW